MNRMLPLWLFSAALCLASASCASTTKTSADSDILYADGPDMKAAQFESGRPRIGDGLAQSLQQPEITLQLMQDNLRVLKLLPLEKFKIVGATDDVECAEDECTQLSQRRAKAMIDWLIQQGIPASMLIPEVRGPYLGYGRPYTEGERGISRRVDIEIVVTDADKEK